MRRKYLVAEDRGVAVLSVNKSDITKDDFTAYLDRLGDEIRSTRQSFIIIDFGELSFLTAENRKMQIDWFVKNNSLINARVYTFIFIISNDMVRIIVNSILNESNFAVPYFFVKTMNEALSYTVVFT